VNVASFGDAMRASRFFAVPADWISPQRLLLRFQFNPTANLQVGSTNLGTLFILRNSLLASLCLSVADATTLLATATGAR
jgi:hypothetical protein